VETQNSTQDAQSYSIKTEAFEGPFALLLDLVEKRKLFINDVSLAGVTEDYIKYINTQGNIEPGHISSFIVVAATLILIKSKSLLPNLDLTNDEEGDIHTLEERLRLFELFSRLSLHIKSDFGKRIIFPPNERKADTVVFLPDDHITRESMMTFAKGAIGAMPKKEVLQEVEVKKVISIEEMIDKLTERIQNSLNKMNFRDMTSRSTATKEEKLVVIVGFLAMLELVRQGILNAIQNGDKEEIYIEKQAPDLNEYLNENEN
jgi:segregation and condensation protein A